MRAAADVTGCTASSTSTEASSGLASPVADIGAALEPETAVGAHSESQRHHDVVNAGDRLRGRNGADAGENNESREEHLLHAVFSGLGVIVSLPAGAFALLI